MPELVALYVDALDSNHINPEVTPNLHRWREQGSMAELSTLFAYKGISAAMYGGVPPRKSGVWMDFKVRETPDPMLGDSLLSIGARLPSGLPRKAAVTAYERIIRGSQVTPHIIPADLRPYFQPHPTKAWTDDRPLGEIPTIFDVFQENNISFQTIGLAGGPQGRIKKKLLNIEDYDEDVVLLKITQLDHVGHKYGPGTKEHNDSLREVDELLGEVVEGKADFDLLVFSDHGMQNIKDSVDLRSGLTEEIGLTEGQDFIAFYNSTCALIRWTSANSKDQTQRYLKDSDLLSLLTEEQLEELEIGVTAREFADDVIATQPGVVVSPDFYRYTPPEGMHGFIENPHGGPIAITPHHQLERTGELWDIAPTVLEQLSFSRPNKWVGESLLQ